MKLLAIRLWVFRAKPSSTPNAENAEHVGFSIKKCRKLQKCAFAFEFRCLTLLLEFLFCFEFRNQIFDCQHGIVEDGWKE